MRVGFGSPSPSPMPGWEVLPKDSDYSVASSEGEDDVDLLEGQRDELESPAAHGPQHAAINQQPRGKPTATKRRLDSSQDGAGTSASGAAISNSQAMMPPPPVPKTSVSNVGRPQPIASSSSLNERPLKRQKTLGATAVAPPPARMGLNRRHTTTHFVSKTHDGGSDSDELEVVSMTVSATPRLSQAPPSHQSQKPAPIVIDLLDSSDEEVPPPEKANITTTTTTTPKPTLKGKESDTPAQNEPPRPPRKFRQVARKSTRGGLNTFHVRAKVPSSSPEPQSATLPTEQRSSSPAPFPPTTPILDFLPSSVSAAATSSLENAEMQSPITGEDEEEEVLPEPPKKPRVQIARKSTGGMVSSTAKGLPPSSSAKPNASASTTATKDKTGESSAGPSRPASALAAAPSISTRAPVLTKRNAQSQPQSRAATPPTRAHSVINISSDDDEGSAPLATTIGKTAAASSSKIPQLIQTPTKTTAVKESNSAKAANRFFSRVAAGGNSTANTSLSALFSNGDGKGKGRAVDGDDENGSNDVTAQKDLGAAIVKGKEVGNSRKGKGKEVDNGKGKEKEKKAKNKSKTNDGSFRGLAAGLDSAYASMNVPTPEAARKEVGEEATMSSPPPSPTRNSNTTSTAGLPALSSSRIPKRVVAPVSTTYQPQLRNNRASMSPTKQTTLDSFVQRSPSRRSSIAEGSRIVAIPPIAGPSGAGTPPDSQMLPPLQADGPDMRGLEDALGLGDIGDIGDIGTDPGKGIKKKRAKKAKAREREIREKGSGGSMEQSSASASRATTPPAGVDAGLPKKKQKAKLEKEKGKRTEQSSASASRPETPVNIPVKEQPVSPKIPAAKRVKRPEGLKFATVADAIQHGAQQRIQQQKRKKRVAASVNLAGLGSLNDPFDLTLDDDEVAGIAAVPGPSSAASKTKVAGTSKVLPVSSTASIAAAEPLAPVTTTATVTAPDPPRPPPTMAPQATTSEAVTPSMDKLKEMLQRPVAEPSTVEPTTSSPPSPMDESVVSNFTQRRSVSRITSGDSSEADPMALSSRTTPPSRSSVAPALLNPLPATSSVAVLTPVVLTASEVAKPSEQQPRASVGDAIAGADGTRKEVMSTGSDSEFIVVPRDDEEEAGMSDGDAIMEIGDLLLGESSRESTSGVDDITTALGSQGIAGARVSEDHGVEENITHNEHPSPLPSLRPTSSRKTSKESSPVTPPPENLGGPDTGEIYQPEEEDDELLLQPGSDLQTKAVPTAALIPTGKIYGGFPTFTFDDYRAELQNDPSKVGVAYARDLPHALQDQINFSTLSVQMMPELRKLFQACIQENTVVDEPDAPPIEILNDLDDDPTPPWEFHYSNQMWHADDVPPPDLKNLVGCDCVGKCDPFKSKGCSCLAKQGAANAAARVLYNEEPAKSADFVYDKGGRLKTPGIQVPIHECNALCQCDQDCRNRVVQNGRKVAVSIRKTPKKGWGVFAGGKKIPKGTFLGVYSGEVITNEEGEIRGIAYNKWGKTYLFDLDFWHLKGEVKYVVDAYHAGNFTRFLNHSCNPNCCIFACYVNEGNQEKPMLVIFSSRDIEPFEEVCFDYTGNDEDEESQSQGGEGNNGTNDAVYIKCQCGAANCRGKMFK